MFLVTQYFIESKTAHRFGSFLIDMSLLKLKPNKIITVLSVVPIWVQENDVNNY